MEIAEKTRIASESQALKEMQRFQESGPPNEPLSADTAPQPALHDLNRHEPGVVFRTLTTSSHHLAAWTPTHLYLALPALEKGWAGDCQTRNFHTPLGAAQLLASLREQGPLVTQPYPSPDFWIENRKGGAA
ncbi:hypothetical protein [Roseobacter denitrificans]|uniref:hypothetical protein n=1 Tax=Roseobacter denitrificans TaxID=2434 RepID=UPI001160131C|nr:hypothetical protein [Roseobacter denitrificans]